MSFDGSTTCATEANDFVHIFIFLFLNVIQLCMKLRFCVDTHEFVPYVSLYPFSVRNSNFEHKH